MTGAATVLGRVQPELQNVFDYHHLRLLVAYQQAINSQDEAAYRNILKAATDVLADFKDEPRAYYLMGRIIGNGVEMQWLDQSQPARAIGLSEECIRLIEASCDPKSPELRTLRIRYTWITACNNMAYANYLGARDEFSRTGMWNEKQVDDAIHYANLVKKQTDIHHRWTPHIYDTVGCIALPESRRVKDPVERLRTLTEAHENVDFARKFREVMHLDISERRLIGGHIDDIEFEIRAVRAELERQ